MFTGSATTTHIKMVLFELNYTDCFGDKKWMKLLM